MGDAADEMEDWTHAQIRKSKDAEKKDFIKTCDYCKAVGKAYTFLNNETICHKCFMSVPTEPRLLRKEVFALRARNAELEKYNERWHEIADGFIGKKLDTHLGDKICIIGWKRDEHITRIAELEAEGAWLRKALRHFADKAFLVAKEGDLKTMSNFQSGGLFIADHVAKIAKEALEDRDG